MGWAGAEISQFPLPIHGRHVNRRWLPDIDESFYWSYDEDVYEDLL